MLAAVAGLRGKHDASATSGLSLPSTPQCCGVSATGYRSHKRRFAMFKRMLSMSLGLAFLAGMTGTTFGASTAKAEVATPTACPTAAAQLGGTYSYKTKTEALQ